MRRPLKKMLTKTQLERLKQRTSAGLTGKPKKTSRYQSRKFIPVSPNTMGTIRQFETRKELKWHIDLVRKTNQLFSAKHQLFEFVPTQIFLVDKNEARTVERAFRAPNIRNILFSSPRQFFNSDFGKSFLRKMEKKGVKLEELRNALKKASDEINTIASQYVRPIDTNKSNILVLDFDPVSKKPLIAIVDHGYSTHT